jgi:type I restriction enzyme, S subunit
LTRLFDKANYQALLKRLEISEINSAALERTQRLDSFYYSKTNLLNEHKLRQMKARPVTEGVKISDGNHLGVSEQFSETGIPYYRGQDIYNFFIGDTHSPLRVPQTTYDLPTMCRSHLKKGDVLMSIVGAIIGKVALVESDTPAMCSCKLAILRPSKFLGELVAVFLQTSYGQSQIERLRRGGGQTGFLLEDFDQLLMPDFSPMFALKMKELILQMRSLLQESHRCYAAAETVLLSELGLLGWQPPAHTVTQKNLSEFLTSGRLDAEYYQPKYDSLLASLLKLKHLRLEEIVTIKKSIEPGSDEYQAEGIPFIRVSDLSTLGLSCPEIFLNKEKYDHVMKPEKGTILLSKDGSVGIAYKTEQNLDAVTSSAILHLTVTDKKVNSDYLTLVLNSFIVKMQAERDAGGSIIQHWKPSEIAAVVVPVLPLQSQKRIADKIQESFALRAKSQGLLELAKRAVEIAIESGEDAALALLKEAK